MTASAAVVSVVGRDASALPKAQASVLASFEAFFRTHALRATRLALLLGADDPEDVAQEAFSRVFSKPGAAREASSGEWSRSYLDRVIINIINDQYRKKVIQRRLRPLILISESVDANHEHSTLTSLLVSHHIKQLPLRRRAALVLRYYFDLPFKEIAIRLGVTEGAAKSYVSKALSQIKSELATAEGPSDD